MKITNLLSYLQRTEAKTNRKIKSVGYQTGRDGVMDADTVSLSEESMEYLILQEKARSVSGIRAELVERIKSEIASGQYHIDANRLAEAMLREGLF